MVKWKWVNFLILDTCERILLIWVVDLVFNLKIIMVMGEINLGGGVCNEFKYANNGFKIVNVSYGHKVNKLFRVVKACNQMFTMLIKQGCIIEQFCSW
jgi:hypothetical protein